MSVLVTGGAGFIASNIVDSLVESEDKVVIIDNLSRGKKKYINKKAKFYEMNILSDEIEKVFKKENINKVIHQAAQIDVQKSFEDTVFDAENNILGTLNLLNYCVKYDVNKIVYASSAAVYGEPDYLPIDEKHPIKAMSPYGISKHTPEHYLKLYNEVYDLDYTVLRYSNAYGPRQDPKGEGGVISIFVDRMINGKKPIIFGDGEQTRDFIYVGDLVEANIVALEKADNELVNISCNTRASINELIRIINNILESNLSPIYKKEKAGDIRHSELDNTKAKNILAWKPEYSLKEGLIKTVNHYLNKGGMKL